MKKMNLGFLLIKLVAAKVWVQNFVSDSISPSVKELV